MAINGRPKLTSGEGEVIDADFEDVTEQQQSEDDAELRYMLGLD